MIRIQGMKEGTVEELMQDALIQIPLYTKEWTNFNPAEPGITILEQFAGAGILQQKFINRMPFEVQKPLLKMLGFEEKDSKCARILLKAHNVKEDIVLPANQKFHVGEIGFETNRQTRISACNLIGIYTRYQGKWKSCGAAIRKEIPLSEEVFGKNPQAGDEIYFVFDSPLPAGNDYIAYFHTGGERKRNQVSAGDNIGFAEFEWSYHTTEGFQSILSRDQTFGLIQSGEMRFGIPSEEAEVFEDIPTPGYVIRGSIKKAEYDLPPRIKLVSFGLFEVWQKTTDSICHTFPKQKNVRIYCDLLEEGYIQVFCKEKKGESYRLYHEASEDDLEGRYYTKERFGFGMYEFELDKNKYKYGPAKVRDAIKIVVYSEEMMRRYALGCVYGFDDQMIELPLHNIVPKSFSVIARRVNQEGEYLYDFVRPGKTGEDDLYYELLEKEGQICIRSAGAFMEAELFLCSCSMTLGEEGNVRSDNIFEPVGHETDIIFTNPARGEGGRLKEGFEQVKQRFLEDLHQPHVAVKAEDYENIVLDTPGLCIHKVKALVDYVRNEVSVVVKPHSQQEFPSLSPFYQNVIGSHLEMNKLLSTRVRVIQPAYVPIDVAGTIYVKKHHENSREQIEQILNSRIDYIHGNQQFGELLKFSEVFHEIEGLECVEFIYDLSLNSQNPQYAIRAGVDIKPEESCLLYPGNYYLEINTYME